MITDAEFREWAQSSTKHPVLLVEITHKTGTVYLSDQFYATSAGETPAHVSYDVCLKDTVLVERTLDEDSLGAIRVYNDGSLDVWLDYLFTGYEIKIFIGDKSWPRVNFKRQFLGTVDSFEQLSAMSYEFKSTLTTSVVQSSVRSTTQPWIAGNHVGTPPIFVGNNYGIKMHRIASADQFNRADVSVTYNGYPATIEWYDTHPFYNTFYLPDYHDKTEGLAFTCDTVIKKFKALFLLVCASVNQPVNELNLSQYPINPDINVYIDKPMTFPEFLTLTLETLGAVLWVNDGGEIEIYQKRDPSLVSDSEVVSWIAANEKPQIKSITKEAPVTTVVSRNPDHDHTSESGPYHYEYNVLDLDFPNRTVITHSYAEDADAIIEARRMADLLAVTRRTYSVTINRISPELFIGAIVNIYSPKDRWEENGQGLNALVVGFTQSFKSNKSELIVWR
jgi:hypothetical protein